jgi:hypothetical protein
MGLKTSAARNRAAVPRLDGEIQRQKIAIAGGVLIWILGSGLCVVVSVRRDLGTDFVVGDELEPGQPATGGRAVQRPETREQ